MTAAAAPVRQPNLAVALAVAALVHGAVAVGTGVLVAPSAPEGETFVRLTLLDAVPVAGAVNEIVPVDAPRPDVPQPDIPPPPTPPPPELPPPPVELPVRPALAPPADLAIPVDAAPEPVPEAPRRPPPPPAPAVRQVPMEQGIPADYFRRFRSAIEGHALRSYPRRSIERGEEGTVTLRITLLEDGTVAEVEVVGGGTDASARLRHAALRAARRVEKFERLPSGTGTRVLNLPIVYRIR